MRRVNSRGYLLLVSSFLVLVNCGNDNDIIRVSGKAIGLDFARNGETRLISKIGNVEQILGDFTASEFVSINDDAHTDYRFAGKSEANVNDEIGNGTRTTLEFASEALRKSVAVTHYDDFPSVLTFRVTHTNLSQAQIDLSDWANNSYRLSVDEPAGAPAFWAYQSGSYESRADWVLPLEPGFSQQNYMGMNNSDYGGGTPIVDVWRRDVGIGVGHLEVVPKLLSLPTALGNANYATIGVSKSVHITLQPGESFTTPLTFATVHEGDYFSTLTTYRDLMGRRGITFNQAPDTAFEPVWCAWGYERDFSMAQVYGTLPMVKDLGYKWAVLDDGWQTAEGDWHLIESKFPNGDADMIEFVDNIHAEGLKAKLWWSPLAVDPGTDLIAEHPEYLLLNEDGSTQDITWWDSYYLCPAYPGVIDYTVGLVATFMDTWGFDGLKIDGQHLNGVPPCYNPAHGHSSPEDAVEALPQFFAAIYNEANRINEESVTEICPCGTAYNFFMLPFMDQSVSSDPLTSWQIRLKGKTLKALAENNVAYYGDHVELSDNKSDFASTVGVGGVIGTKFIWPEGANPDPMYDESGDLDLTAERAEYWDKWMSVWEIQGLQFGEYRGDLYDIGFDQPETHVVEKDGVMHYALFADNFSGTVDFRGLGDGEYALVDYVNGEELGKVSRAASHINIEVNGYLLLEAIQ